MMLKNTNGKDLLSLLQDSTVTERKISMKDYLNLNFFDLEFQRPTKKDAKCKSLIIDSIILGLPMNPIYLWDNGDNNYGVIDGLGRTTTFIEFDDNVLKLQNMLDERLNGNVRRTLPTEVYSKFLEYNLTLHVFSKDTSIDAIIAYFERLNTVTTMSPWTKLKAKYNGNVTRFVSKSSKTQDFMSLFSEVETQKQLHEKTITTFYATVSMGIDNYSTNINSKFFKDFESVGDYKFKEWQELFNQCMEIGSKLIKGYPTISSIVPTLYCLSRCDKKALMKRNLVKPLQEAFIKLFSSEEYYNTYGNGHGDSKENVCKRVELIKSAISDIIGTDEKERRFANKNEKKLVKAKSSTCSICEGEIYREKDVDVHHVIEFKKGGKTKISNLAPTHASCNRGF